MLVKDVMTWNVVTIPSNTPVLEAERLLEAQKFERLPVVDKGKLVGIVTKDDLLRSGPSQATSFSRGELLYLLSKLTVKDIMKKDVITVDLNQPIEKAVAVAQREHVGCLVVMEEKRVVGILTTNDVFYKVLNPLLGIGDKGTHIIVKRAGDGEPMQKVIELVNKSGIKIKSIFNVKSTEEGVKDLILQLDSDDVTTLVSDICKLGYSSESRPVK
jgi:acetoin utilization protein AcuB